MLVSIAKLTCCESIMGETIRETSLESRSVCVVIRELNLWPKLRGPDSVIPPAKQPATIPTTYRQAGLIIHRVVIRATRSSTVAYRLVFPATGGRLGMAVQFGSCRRAVTVNTMASRYSPMVLILVWRRPAMGIFSVLLTTSSVVCRREIQSCE